MIYDPYSGAQLKAHRTDPTGRWSPITEETISLPWWAVLYGFIAGVLVFAFVIGFVYGALT